MKRILSIVLLALLAIAVAPAIVAAQSLDKDGAEEITIQVNVPGVGSIIVPAVFLSDTLYLPIIDLFAALHLKADLSADGAILTGFIENESRPYRIDMLDRRIEYGAELTLSPAEMILTDERTYLRSDLFGTIFGLNCAFDFRGLTVTVRTNFELPMVKAMMREKLRGNLGHLSDSVTFDKRIDRAGSLLRVGVLDWGAGSTINTASRSTRNYALGLGGELAGGEFSLTVYGDENTTPRWSDLGLRLRFIGDENSLLRQTVIGQIGSVLPFPYNQTAIGARITNASPVYRKAFGTYAINDMTEPGWTVELYINRQLVDVTTADADGYYHFDVPIGYGSTAVMLKFYGPWGEERMMDRLVRIPFTFVPAGEVEYDLSGGMLDGEISDLFTKARVSAGISSNITLTGGASLLSRSGQRTTIPFVEGAMRITDQLLLSGEYRHGLDGRGLLSYTLPSQLGLELSYVHADSIRTLRLSREASDRLGLGIFFPFMVAGVRSGAQIDLRAERVGSERSLQGSSAIMTSMFGVPTTVTSMIDMREDNGWLPESLRVALRSSFMVRMLGGVTAFRPNVEIDALHGSIAQAGLDVERSLFSGVGIGASLAHDFTTSMTKGQLTLRCDLSFARSSISASSDGRQSTFGVFAQGSVAYDGDEGVLLASNRSGLGRGAITLAPFLDLNNNGLRDDDEPRVTGIDVAIEGGEVERSAADSMVRIVDLQPYHNYIMHLSAGGFENISWKPRHNTYLVNVGANGFQEIAVPVIVGAEISGHVTRATPGGEKGVVGMTIHFTQTDGSYRDSVVTTDDGEYFYLGLPAGHYVAEVDAAQRARLGLSDGGTFEFDVRRGIDGDVLENRNIVLR